LIWAAATVLTGLAPSFGLLIAARLLLGFGEGASLPAATRAMSDWITPDKRALVQGLTHSSARLGNALTPILISSLMMVSSWRGSFVILGAVSFTWAVVWWFYFRDDPRDHPSITGEELLQMPPPWSASQRAQVPWRRLVLRMLPVTGVYFCYGWTLWLYLAWIPLFFLHHYRLNLKNSAWFSTGVFFAGVIGDTLGGILSDHIYANTGDRNRARRNLIIGGFLLSLAFMIPLLYVTDLRWRQCASAPHFSSPNSRLARCGPSPWTSPPGFPAQPAG